MYKHMRTSFDLPDALLRKAKALARQRGTTVRALVEEGLRRVVAQETTPKQPFRLEDGSFKGDGLVPGLEWGDWDRIRELLYEDHRG